MGFFSRLFCCGENALSVVDDIEKPFTEKPYKKFELKNVKCRGYVKQSKGILFKSSFFYKSWLESFLSGYPTVLTPSSENQRSLFRDQVHGFNSGIRGLMLVSMQSMENIPLVAEVDIGVNSIFVFIKEKYFYKPENERLEYLSKLINISC